jgi:hypothetical protein
VQVRKAYKKFALRVHPDKAAAACRFGVGVVPGTQLVGDAPAIQVWAQQLKCLRQAHGHVFLDWSMGSAGIWMQYPSCASLCKPSNCKHRTASLPESRCHISVPYVAAMQAAVQEQANKLFASISEANTVLSDPVRRKEVRVPEGILAGLPTRFHSSAALLQGQPYLPCCRPHDVCMALKAVCLDCSMMPASLRTTGWAEGALAPQPGRAAAAGPARTHSASINITLFALQPPQLPHCGPSAVAEPLFSRTLYPVRRKLRRMLAIRLGPSGYKTTFVTETSSCPDCAWVPAHRQPYGASGFRRSGSGGFTNFSNYGSYTNRCAYSVNYTETRASPCPIWHQQANLHVAKSR